MSRGLREMDESEVRKLIKAELAQHVYEHHKKRCAKSFVPPTPAEVRAWANSVSLLLDVEQFIDFYESKGWVVGKSPMKSWQAAARRAVKEGWAKTNRPPKVDTQKCACGCGMPAKRACTHDGRRYYTTACWWRTKQITPGTAGAIKDIPAEPGRVVTASRAMLNRLNEPLVTGQGPIPFDKDENPVEKD